MPSDPETLAAVPMNGAEAVAHVIASQPKPVVYGVPGGYAMYIYDALYPLQNKVAIHLVRQESVATVMAEAHGRLTGRPAFVIGQGAWVLGNAGIGIMEAHLGASPMVILIDATDGGAYSHLGPYQGGLAGYGSYDLAGAMRAITKRTFVAQDPTQALQMTQLAVKHATTGEPGPVAVIFTARALRSKLGASAEPQAYPDRAYATPTPVADPAAIAAAAAVLRGAARPVIVAGNGVRLAKAEASLLAFAARHGVPVATTPAGKGVFPESDDLGVGVMGGFGHDTANRVVGDADVILALGTKLGASDTANMNRKLIDLSRQKLVQVDVEPLNLAWTFPADVTVQGDLAEALPRISEALGTARTEGARRVAEARVSDGYFDRAFTSEPGALSARDVVQVLSRELPADAIVTCDAGENRLFVLRDYQTKPGGTVLQPNGGGGMGYAVAAAVGAAVDFPGRTVVGVCGDGGISMSLHSLISAVELGLTLTIVVLDNGVLGWVYSGQAGRHVASEFKDFDYAAIAAAMGCRAARVETLDDFAAALSAAKSHEGVSVIVAKTGRNDRYQHMMASLNAVDVYGAASTAAKAAPAKA
jgi:acetolactate synthase-1/2/3 large subunit